MPRLGQFKGKKDLKGQPFGEWTVLEYIGVVDHVRTDTASRNRKYYLWLCECSCGIRKKVFQHNLIRKLSTSCGHTRNSPRLPGEIPARNRLLRAYKNNAKTRGLDWNLSDEQFFKITKRNCVYCGLHPTMIQKSWSGSRRETYIYNGVDRQNNKQGYNPGNCVPCCQVCQRGKMDMDYLDFIEHQKRVAYFWGEG